MGRGGRDGVTDSAGFRVASGRAASVSDLFQPDPSEAGALLELPDGSRMELSATDPAAMLRGFVEVESVDNLLDSTYEVRFRNGEVARLSLDEGAVAFLSGEESDSLAAAAFAASMAHRNSVVGPEQLSSVPETQELLARLNDVYASLLEDPSNQELLREFGSLSQELAQQGLSYSRTTDDGDILEKTILPSDVVLGDPNMERRIDGDQVQDESGAPGEAALRREKTEMVIDAMNQLAEGADGYLSKEQALYAVVGGGFNPDAPTEIHFMATPEEIAEGRRAALILSGQMNPETGEPIGITQEELDAALDPSGHPGVAAAPNMPGTIPDVLETGRIKITPLVKENLARVRRNWTATKQRTFIFRGPPGTGKDTLAEIMAAGESQPIVKIQLGGSNDPANAKGGYSVQSVTVSEPDTELVEQEDGTFVEQVKRVRVEDPDSPGDWLRDESGEIVTKPRMIERTYTETNTVEGVMTKAAQLPAMIVIQEPEGVEHDMVQLHGLFGDRIADVNGREIYIDSPEGKSVSVHPRCTIVITTNEEPSNHSDDGRFKAATYSRAYTLTLPDLSIPESADRLANNVNTAIDGNRYFDAWPSLRKEYAANDLTLFAQIQQELQASYRSGGALVIGPDSRKMATAYIDFVTSAASPDTVNPMADLYEHFKYMMPSSSMTDQEMNEELDEILSDYRAALTELVDSISRDAEEHRKKQSAGV